MMKTFQFNFRAMASDCELRFSALDQKQANVFADKSLKEIKRIEWKFSRYRSDSVISKINQNAGFQAVHVDKETNDLLDYADVLYHSSDGLFDICSGVLRRAWNFQAANIPSQSFIDTLLPLVAWSKVKRDSSSIFLPIKEMEIDFGGFGKEYAADRVAFLLQEQGVMSGLINLGGDLRSLGQPLNTNAWKIGIQDPRSTENICAHIELVSGALATSGDYERFFEVNGQRYCHLLNPRTGKPVHYWQSISVLAPVTIAAGSLATIAMLKQEEGLSWLGEQNVAFLCVDQFGNVLRKELSELSK